jgi:hypothetical protein
MVTTRLKHLMFPYRVDIPFRSAAWQSRSSSYRG